MPAFHAFTIAGIPEISAGDDLASFIIAGLASQHDELVDGDILVVTSKIVSKAEGRIIAAGDREDAITRETVRLVASRAHPGGVTRIVENRQGLVLAAAGVDASNTADGTVLLLPVDPDESARKLCGELRARTGARVGLIISDTLGRAWRDGQIDTAIGAAGVQVMDDLRGSTDSFGNELSVTQAAVGDELASATDLVKGKAGGLPVAVVRGLDRLVTDSLQTPARRLVRTGPSDMFRLGTDEAIALGDQQGYDRGFADGSAFGLANGNALTSSRIPTPSPTPTLSPKSGMGREAAADSAGLPAFRSSAFIDIPRPHFADVVIVPLPAGASSDPLVWAETIFSSRSMPKSVLTMLGLRQALVQIIGIPPAPKDTFAVDDVVGEEALIIADDSHLDFRAAVGVDAAAGLVRMTTAVRIKNRRGRLYFAPVRLAHPAVVRSMMLKAARELSAKWYE
jgi:coenzyme F420-0:L-glutamate ligase/coenzyme F420-1:gamma-L-glutamate ligase